MPKPQLSQGAIAIIRATTPRLQEVFDTFLIVGVSRDESGSLTRHVIADKSCRDPEPIRELGKMLSVANALDPDHL